MRLGSFAAVVTLWFTANSAMTGQQQAQTDQWQARLAAQSRQDAALTNAYGQLSAGNAATRAAVIQKLPQLGHEIPEEQQHVDTLIRNYLWNGLSPNRCTPIDEIPIDVKAAFESIYDDFKIMHFNDDGDGWATLNCMEKTSADTIEVKWRQIILQFQPGHADDYSATLHIDKNFFGLGLTKVFLSCNCYELSIFTTRQRYASMDLTKNGSDSREPYQADVHF